MTVLGVHRTGRTESIHDQGLTAPTSRLQEIAPVVSSQTGSAAVATSLIA